MADSDRRDLIKAGSGRERMVLGAALAAAGFVLLLDQMTKIVVEREFILHESRPVWDGFFSLTFVRNYGAAWSMFSGYGWFLLAVALLVTVGALWFFRYLTDGFIERYFAIFVILGGVAGNSIDRIWRGAVVDFLDFHFRGYHWPVFNVADIAICVGVGIFILSSIVRKPRREASDSPEEAESH